jgi:hypothetical protein
MEIVLRLNNIIRFTLIENEGKADIYIRLCYFNIFTGAKVSCYKMQTLINFII